MASRAVPAELDLTGAVWRTSSRSHSAGECVEVARAAWRTSRRSQSAGQCVEVAALDRRVAVRDSKDPAGPVLAFTPTAWAKLLASLKDA